MSDKAILSISYSSKIIGIPKNKNRTKNPQQKNKNSNNTISDLNVLKTAGFYDSQNKTKGNPLRCTFKENKKNTTANTTGINNHTSSIYSEENSNKHIDKKRTGTRGNGKSKDFVSQNKKTVFTSSGKQELQAKTPIKNYSIYSESYHKQSEPKFYGVKQIFNSIVNRNTSQNIRKGSDQSSITGNFNKTMAEQNIREVRSISPERLLTEPKVINDTIRSPIRNRANVRFKQLNIRQRRPAQEINLRQVSFQCHKENIYNQKKIYLSNLSQI